MREVNFRAEEQENLYFAGVRTGAREIIQKMLDAMQAKGTQTATFSLLKVELANYLESDLARTHGVDCHHVKPDGLSRGHITS
jgi:hypothetical protein